MQHDEDAELAAYEQALQARLELAARAELETKPSASTSTSISTSASASTSTSAVAPLQLGVDEQWRQRYYLEKMHMDMALPAHHERLESLFSSYIEGLNWVMRYYYQGCCSWSWYFPFHYAPLASDLKNVERYPLEFELAAPLRPFSQLMGVLPAASGRHNV